jgi:hypothetical protein
MAESNSAPTPGTETRRRGALVGRWQSDADLVGDAPVPTPATEFFGWLAGAFFLAHHVDVLIGEQRGQAIEIADACAAADSFTPTPTTTSTP